MSVSKFIVPYKIVTEGYVEILAIDDDEARRHAFQSILHDDDAYELNTTDHRIDIGLPMLTEEDEAETA